MLNQHNVRKIWIAEYLLSQVASAGNYQNFLIEAESLPSLSLNQSILSLRELLLLSGLATSRFLDENERRRRCRTSGQP